MSNESVKMTDEEWNEFKNFLDDEIAKGHVNTGWAEFRTAIRNGDFKNKELTD